MRILTRVVALSLVLLSLFAPAIAADSTAFNPTTIKVTAKATSSIPVGTIIAWPVSQNPADMQNPDGSYNWLECNGQSVSQSVYPELFAVVGANVPDLRGLFLRGYGSQTHWQNNGATVGWTNTTHISGELGQVQGDAIRNIYGTFSGTNPDNSAHGDYTPYSTPLFIVYKGLGANMSYHESNTLDRTLYRFDTSQILPTAPENRPVNTAVRYLIRSKM